MKKEKNNQIFKKNKSLIIVLLLSIVFLIAIISKEKLLGSIYNIPDIEIDKVKIGDTINYDINGYSDWQVIGKDNDSGTIEVVSKTNVKDLELEPDKSIDEYKNKLQELANEYVDNKYVVSARSVTKDDLNYFSYEQEFWLDNIRKESISTSIKNWNYTSPSNTSNSVYFIPLVASERNATSDECPNLEPGDYCDTTLFGIDGWIFVDDYTYPQMGKYFRMMIPAIPIKFDVEYGSNELEQQINDIVNSFPTNGGWYPNVISANLNQNVGNYVKEYFKNLGENAVIYRYDPYNANGCWINENDDYLYFNCNSYYKYYLENDYFGNSGGTMITYVKNKTRGFRPVVTLKVKNYEPKKEELDDKLSIGDYIKYSANGYDNWRVLSINKHNNTVDVVSGGVVKNIILSGKNDFDDYENILQNEVDNYKNDSAINSRLIQSDDEPALSLMKDKVTPIYFTNDKKEYIKERKTFDNSSAVNFTISAVGVMNYNSNLNDIVKGSKVLNLDLSGDEAAVDYYKKDTIMMGDDYIYVGDSKYTAGIRPVITIKYDEAEKISNNETEKVEKSSKTYDKVIVREQNNNNGSNNKSNSVDNSKGIPADKEETTIVEKKIYKNSPILKYSVIILYFIDFIEFLIIAYILKKISKKEKKY